ncbi:MAG TPA: hypothetical protein VGJ09_07310 [Bryobacteraceae bacterium]|jgi:hypothetical protein
MQFLSDGPALAAMVVPTHPRFLEFAQRPEIHARAGLFFAIVVGVELLRILWIWVASKTVVRRDSSTVLNALKAWGFTWLSLLAVSIVLILLLPSLPQDATWRLRMVIGGGCMLNLTLAFLVPMKIYVIGLLRAFLVVFLSSLLTGASTVGLAFALMNVLPLQKDLANLQDSIGKTPAEQWAFFQRLAGFESSDEIDRLLDDALHPIGPRPVLAQREALVQNLQRKLEARRRILGSASLETRKAFDGQLIRYKTFLNEVIAERAKPAPAARR